MVLSQAWYSSFPLIGMLFPSFPSEPQNPALVFTFTSWLMRNLPSYTGTFSLIAGKYKVREAGYTTAPNIRSGVASSTSFTGR
jgi:hypothetical protein